MIHQLILYTSDDTPSTGAITERLRTLQFIDGVLNYRDGEHFQAGDHFLDLITFLGCSPTFSLDPDSDEPFCHVSLHQQSSPAFLGGGPHTMVRCPACRETVRKAAAHVDHATLRWGCPLCGHEASAGALPWRKQAGVGNLWVAIWGVQPELAVPNATLIESLAQSSGTPWRYCYLG